jgi:hypothetical protein
VSEPEIVNKRWPRPWKFRWCHPNPPTIYDAEGKVVCVLSTGTLAGAFNDAEISELGKWMASK